jgi:hypothetical protein
VGMAQQGYGSQHLHTSLDVLRPRSPPILLLIFLRGPVDHDAHCDTAETTDSGRLCLGLAKKRHNMRARRGLGRADAVVGGGGDPAAMT